MDIDSIKEHFILIHDDRQSAKVDYPQGKSGTPTSLSKA